MRNWLAKLIQRPLGREMRSRLDLQAQVEAVVQGSFESSFRAFQLIRLVRLTQDNPENHRIHIYILDIR